MVILVLLLLLLFNNITIVHEFFVGVLIRDSELPFGLQVAKVEVHFAFTLVEFGYDKREGDLVLNDAHHVFEFRFFKEDFSFDEFVVADFDYYE